MKYLIDTNVFIPLEPTSPRDVAALTDRVIAFAQKANRAGFPLFVHPAQLRDIRSDRDSQRRALRETLLGKYPLLPEPPATAKIEALLGPADEDHHDWVDHQLLAALQAEAVDVLVTEDIGIHRKAIRLGLHHRVLFIGDAVIALDALVDTVPPALPAVTALKAHNLNGADPIFDSLRAAYPGFDNWLSKCRRKHRQSWVIEANAGGYGGVCLVNREDRPDLAGPGKTLKICTFKISDAHSGFRFGELLLRHVLAFAEQNAFQNLFIEVFPTQDRLLAFLAEFGFEDVTKPTERGELRLVKRLSCEPGEMAGLPAVEVNKRFGPAVLKWADTSAFLVPIQPRFHDLLFPEATPQTSLFAGAHPCGNALRKAYLCNAGTREIRPGDVLLFYRSEDTKAVTVVGVAEETLIAGQATQIARFVGKRTVYPFAEIEKLCAKEVLAILFRQARVLATPLGFATLIAHEVISAAPQSITKLNLTSRKWIQTYVAP